MKRQYKKKMQYYSFSHKPIPDIGLIRNEKKYRIEVINKADGRIKKLSRIFTKSQALEEFEERKFNRQPVRVVHDGFTETGVPMLMISKSYRWRPPVTE